MKVAKHFLGLLFIVIILTGCAINNDIKLGVSKNGEVDLALVFSFDKEALTNIMNMDLKSKKTYTDEELKHFLKKMVEPNSTKEELKKYKQMGFTFEEYERNDFLGYKISAQISNIDNISTDKDVIYDFNNMIEKNIQTIKMFKKEGNKYSAHFTFDPDIFNEEIRDNINNSGIKLNKSVDQYVKEIVKSYTFSVTLPTVPNSHNAASVSEDEKTLTWVINTKETGDIKFDFEFENKAQSPVLVSSNAEETKGKFPITIFVIAFGAIVAGVVVFLIISKNKNKIDSKTNEDEFPKDTNENELMKNQFIPLSFNEPSEDNVSSNENTQTLEETTSESSNDIEATSEVESIAEESRESVKEELDNLLTQHNNNDALDEIKLENTEITLDESHENSNEQSVSGINEENDEQPLIVVNDFSSEVSVEPLSAEELSALSAVEQNAENESEETKSIEDEEDVENKELEEVPIDADNLSKEDVVEGLVTIEPVSDEKGKYCNICNASLSEEDKFCTNCGKKID